MEDIHQNVMPLSLDGITDFKNGIVCIFQFFTIIFSEGMDNLEYIVF